MELKITGTEQEIYSLLGKFQVSNIVDTVTETVEPEVKSVVRIDGTLEQYTEGTTKKRTNGKHGKKTTLLVDGRVFKKFVSVQTAADFIGVSDACLYNAAKVGNKVQRLYNIHIEGYDNSIKEIPDVPIL